MSTIATSGACSSTARSSSSPSSTSAATSIAGVLEQRRDPLAHEQVVVGDHDAHGSSAVTVVPSPGGLVTRRRPSSASTRSARPRSPLPRAVVGAADAVVGDLDPGERRRRATRARWRGSRRRTWRRSPAPRRRRSRRRARPARAAGSRGLARSPWSATAERVASELERGGEPVLEHGGMDAARQLAQLRERQRRARRSRVVTQLLRRRVVADAALEQPQLQRDRDEPLLRAVVQVALEPPALGVAGRDDPLARRLAARPAGPATRRAGCSFSIAIAAAAVTASTSSGSSSSDAS